MGLSSNTMAATLFIPSMAILILIPILLLNLNPTSCNATVNETASEWCDGRSQNCLVGEQNADSEYLMETETSLMLLDFQKLQTPNTKPPDKASVPDCNRPPRYDSCLGQKSSVPHPEHCATQNRVNPC